MAKRASKSKYTPHRHRMLLEVLEGQKPFEFWVKARRADQIVKINRKLVDIARGKKGMAVTCANARCAMRENSHAFPHPVHMAEFTDRRAYIVDKLTKDGHPYSCVVYDHQQGEFQRAFDTKPKSQLVKMSGVEGTVSLYPPARNLPGEGSRKGGRSRAGQDRPQGGPHKTPRIGAHKKKAIGSMARFERHGFSLKQTG